ncbi:PucR family transcriptional regulator [Thermomonospora umbrina]|uniref:PucR-like N-terminal domain-containing protein n=1 Tax=Thermomonospora umbrina TaxID=111806 RepID=A0A3D9SP92_9ACTN|nr:PucR family transcriptional regulator [Thermomonospora umbrina]REE97786.1 hypothetical protein DFJ69_3261 [Thermomonospora umbrina]
MTRVGEAADLAAVRLPKPLVALIRAELPGLADEIVAAIRRDIPEYDRPMNGPYGRVVRMAVRRNLAAFTDSVAGFSGGAARHADLCRGLGRLEAREGRTMDRLQAAYRIGGRVAWRRFMGLAARNQVPPSDMSRLADGLFRFLDALATLSVDGFLEAKACAAASRGERRRTLLRTVLNAAPGADLSAEARRAEWPLPREVTAVAVEAGAVLGSVPLDRDVLADLEGPEPCLLLPGPLNAARRAMLTAALPGRRLAAGLTVPVGRAEDSLRWARQALALAVAGVIEDGPLILCEDHLVTLWLMSDPALTDRIARRGRTDREAREPARSVDDPEARFEIEALLRARSLLDRAAEDGQPSDGGSL